MDTALHWFEIPTSDIDRAQQFYERIFQIKMQNLDNANLKMRLFPGGSPGKGVSGSITQAEGFYTPSETHGPLLYLNANPDVQLVLDRIEGAGGKVVLGKTQISEEFGFMALFIDSEGNRLGIHSD